MHPETFAIATAPIRDQTELGSAIFVDEHSVGDWPVANRVPPPALARNVAVVDRTANFQLAARELVAARTAFGGRSPYAPTCVLVNEFAKQEFLQAVVSESFNSCGDVKDCGDVTGRTSSSGRVNKHIESLKKIDPELRIILQGSQLTVVDLTTRNRDLFDTDFDAPILIVHSIKSLEDAIDLVAMTSKTTPLAAYHFGNPATGKYLAQFVDAAISLVNHIPRELLVGPAFPAGHPIDLSNKYPVDLFSRARPAFINPSKTTRDLSVALSSKDKSAAHKILEQTKLPFAGMKRNPGGSFGKSCSLMCRILLNGNTLTLNLSAEQAFSSKDS